MTDEEIRRELEHARRDHMAFLAAKSALQARLLELEKDPVRYERLLSWAGFQAAFNVLIMCEVQCRGLIEDLTNNIETEAQVLRLVEEEDDEQQPD